METTEASHPCKPCLESAICHGGNLIAPKRGYWRSHNEAEKFFECLNTDACLAGDIENPLGVCGEEYEGPLCSRCKTTFFKRGAE